jgi:hypothetical protein
LAVFIPVNSFPALPSTSLHLHLHLLPVEPSQTP